MPRPIRHHYKSAPQPLGIPAGRPAGGSIVFVGYRVFRSYEFGENPFWIK